MTSGIHQGAAPTPASHQPQKLLTDHLDLWTTAVRHKSTAGRGSGHGKNRKIELAGINKLRELILELAVRGKLVPQNPDDEPASELLKRIETEKVQLIKDGRLKKQKPLPAVTDEEKPFELPQGWEWVRLGDVLEVINGRAYKKHEMLDAGTPLLRVGNLFTSNEWYYSNLELEPNKYIDNGDLIYAWSASFGPFIWEGGKVIYHYHIWKLEIFDENSLFKPFIYNYLKAITEQIKASGNGIAMLHMTKDRMEKLVIPLPPLAEQQRIVTKVNELMALCDQLEQQSEHQLDAHQQLTETLLSTLTDSSDAQQLNDHWQRLAQHFDLLFSGPMGAWAIDRLKDTILQLAVMGKLVPQNPDDEPAAELLKRINAEKARLVKEGKIKKQKPLPPVSEDEKPYELPEGWECYRLGELVTKLGSGSTPRGGQNAYVPSGIPFLRSQNVWNDGLKLDDIVYINDETHLKMENTIVYPGDILLNITGASLGRSIVFPNEITEANVSQHVTIIRLVSSDMIPFMHLCIKSPLVQSLVWGRQVGMAIEGLSKKVLELFEMPIPPLAEQHRIVAKVDELFALCDQLKERLQHASDTQLNLTDALVEQALS